MIYCEIKAGRTPNAKCQLPVVIRLLTDEIRVGLIRSTPNGEWREELTVNSQAFLHTRERICLVINPGEKKSGQARGIC